MRAAFVALTLGGILVYSGIKGLSVLEALAGEKGNPLDPKGGITPAFNRATNASPGSDRAQSGPVSGSPKNIIDTVVIPLARKNGINVSVKSVEAANARHSTRTLTGGRSDHSGPPSKRWAIDASNGSRPTEEMDQLAEDLAREFNIPWNGSGAKSATHGKYRYQLIYRSMVGGNHFNHVHFGIELVG